MNASSSNSADPLPRPLFVLFPVVLMDMVGFGFIIPILPDYAMQFGATPTLIGLLTASYAFGQFLVSPIIGRLSDRFGRKPLMLLSVAGTCGALLLIGSAWSLPVLFAARLLDGLTGANVTVAQSYIADVTTPKQRARALGMIGAAFGLGFIFGPLFGGVLVGFGYPVPAFVAAGIAVVNFVVIATVLPESRPVAGHAPADAAAPIEPAATDPDATAAAAERGSAAPGGGGRGDGARRRNNPLSVLTGAFAALRTRTVGPLLGILALYSLAFTLFELTFSLFALEALGLSARVRSFLLAYVGVVVAFVQGVAIGPLSRWVGEKRLTVISQVTLALSLVLFAFAPSLWYLAAVLLPLSVSAGLINPLLRSILSQSVDPAETGSVFGVATSFDSLARIVAPTLGGLLIGRVGTWAPGTLGALLVAVVAVLCIVRFRPFVRRADARATR